MSLFIEGVNEVTVVSEPFAGYNEKQYRIGGIKIYNFPNADSNGDTKVIEERVRGIIDTSSLVIELREKDPDQREPENYQEVVDKTVKAGKHYIAFSDPEKVASLFTNREQIQKTLQRLIDPVKKKPKGRIILAVGERPQQADDMTFRQWLQEKGRTTLARKPFSR